MQNNFVIVLKNDTSKKITNEKINVLLQNTRKSNFSPGKIIVPTINRIEFLEIADIIRCQSEINCTTIYQRDKKKLVVAKTLKEFEEMLSEYNFFSIHNSSSYLLKVIIEAKVAP